MKKSATDQSGASAPGVTTPDAKNLDAKTVVINMVKALNQHVIEGQEAYWKADAPWNGPAGAGVKSNLKHFQEGWQKPFLEAFPDKHTVDDVVIGEGEWAAAMGTVTATHDGEFLGAEPTGKTIKLKYMDFWKVKDGKIEENWVLLDIVDFFRQIGIDLLDGKGWDERGRDRAAPAVAAHHDED